MPFDTMTMAAVTDELQSTLAGGRIQKIVQPSEASVGLGIYGAGVQHWLLLSADSRFARVQLAGERLAKAFATPSPFVMLLRKYLDGGRVTEVQQLAGERILRLECSSEKESYCVVAEVMGKHSNVMLLDEASKVLGAIKIVSPRLSPARPVLPGRTYSPPPTQTRDPALYSPGPRLDPSLAANECKALLRAVEPATPIRTALLGLLQGTGPFLVEQIILAARLEPTALLRETEVGDLLEVAAGMYRLFQTRVWRPCTFTDRVEKQQYAAFHPLGVHEIVEAPSMSAAIERCVGARESHDSLASSRRSLLSAVQRRRSALGDKLDSLHRGLAAADNAENIMQLGQLVLAYAHTIGPRSEQLELPEMEVTIPLDPGLNPAENAAKFFRRYRKLRDARKRIPLLVQETEREAGRLDDIITFARLAQSETDLRDLKRDFEPAVIEKRSKMPKKASARGPARYLWNEGASAMVGRNARENEDVTFRLARRDDLWLHARERTGAHVILERRGTEPSDQELEAAAQLAGYFSAAREDSGVDVIIAEVRNVRKIPGGPPGRVTYQHSRTLRVRPGIGTWVPQKRD
jgi:predicted ribosome quality control (RQC) complex YloA/Tae2 family protein